MPALQRSANSPEQPGHCSEPEMLTRGAGLGCPCCHQPLHSPALQEDALVTLW